VPRKTTKTRQENEEFTNHPRTASPKIKCTSLACSQKTGGKGPDAVRRSPNSRNYITVGICRQKGRYTNTDCQKALTQHQHSSVTAIRCLKTEIQRGTRQIQDSVTEKTKERWRGKRMHGQLPRNFDEKLLDIVESSRWLKSVDIKGEAESTLVAAQDQASSTNYFENILIILKTKIESKCKQHEIIDHPTSGYFST